MTTRAGSIVGGTPRSHGDHFVARWTRSALFGLVVASGCGGPAQEPAGPEDMARIHQPHASRPDAAPGGAGEVANGAAKEPGEEGMAPVLAKFHDTMAPRWHAEHGAKRTEDTCGAIGPLRGDAEAVAAAPAPAGSEPAAWKSGGKQLVDAVAELAEACKANDDAAFEQAFGAVHQRFHHLMEAGGGHGH